MVMKISLCSSSLYNRDKRWHNNTLHSLLFTVFAFSCCSWAILHLPLLMLLCFLLLNILFCVHSAVSLHTPYTQLPSAPWAPHETPHCCSAASQRDSRQSLTRLFSSAAAVAADDPLDLFCGILMWFDLQRGLRRSHNTCLNTLSLAHLSLPCVLNLAPQISLLLPSCCVTAPFVCCCVAFFSLAYAQSCFTLSILLLFIYAFMCRLSYSVLFILFATCSAVPFMSWLAYHEDSF